MLLFWKAGKHLEIAFGGTPDVQVGQMWALHHTKEYDGDGVTSWEQAMPRLRTVRDTIYEETFLTD
jgi:hypothetical protein